MSWQPSTRGSWVARASAQLDGFVPHELAVDADVQIRARLLVVFPLILMANAPVFAASYAVLGDWWSALVLVVAWMALALTPVILRITHTIAPASHWLGVVLTFTLLAPVPIMLAQSGVRRASNPRCAADFTAYLAASRFCRSEAVATAQRGSQRRPVTIERSAC